MSGRRCAMGRVPLVVALCLCACLGVWRDAGAQATTVPPEGLAAEGNGEWEVAARVYRDVLAQDPARADLWVRVADIEARLGNLDAAVAALEGAVRADEANPDLHVRLSQAYATRSQPMPALASIDRALALRPSDPEYLRAGAVLATWTGDYEKAYVRYEQLQALEPLEPALMLNLARVSVWSGRTAQAVEAYRAYLAQRPDVADAWIELATAESWRGNDAGALAAIEAHDRRFPPTRARTLALARVLAGAGRPSRAMRLLDPLWQEDPSDYEVNLARAIASAWRRRVGDARGALDAARLAQPDSAETLSAGRFVRATIGSFAGPGVSYYADSDDLQIVTVAPAATVRLRSGTDMSVGYARSELRAPTAGGLGTSTGVSVALDRGWVGVAQSVAGLTLSGRVGSALSEGERTTEHAVGIRWRADTFTLGAERSRDIVAISPRTIELGLIADRYSVEARWTPTVAMALDVEGSVSELSDGNRRWELRVSPRHAVVRSSLLNLDLGGTVYRLQATRDLSNGYYDPRVYEAYQGTAFPYFKLSEEMGLGISMALGAQRERGLPFRFGGSATVEMTAGIYRAWLLRVSAGATHNLRRESGAFGGRSVGLTLQRRF